MNDENCIKDARNKSIEHRLWLLWSDRLESLIVHIIHLYFSGIVLRRLG